MNQPTANVFHVLSLPRKTADRAEARGTVRSGALQAGDPVWFVTPGGDRHELEVVAIKDGERHVLLELSGAAESLGALAGGFYLYGG